MVVIRGIADPGLAFWVQLDFCNMGLLADMIMLGIVADVGEVGGLLIKGAVLLVVFLVLREDNFLCWLFLIHSGVQMTLLLAISGVILGDGVDDGLPGTPVASSGS